MSRIFSEGKPEFDRKRRVRESGASLTPPPAPRLTTSPVEEVFSDFRKVINSANAVLPYLAEAAKVYSIPVPKNMPELRAAVSRKDSSNSSGSTISFDLFAKTLSHYESLRNKFSKESLGLLTGNRDLDARNIADLSSKSAVGLSDDDMPIWNSNWFIRFTLWGLLKQFAVNTIVKQTATKLPPGTEAGGYIADFIQSVGLGLAIDAANAEFAELAAEGNAYAKSYIESGAASSLKGSDITFSKLEQMAIDKVGEADFAKIMDYSMKEIGGATGEVGLVSWLSYANARGIRNDSVEAYRRAPQYTQPAPDGSGAKVSMSEEYLSALNKSVRAMNGSLVMTVQVAGLSFSADMICCLAKLFGGISINKLKAVRQTLRLASRLRVSEFSYCVNQTAGGYTNFMQGGTSHALICLLERTIDNVTMPALDTVNFDDESYRLMSDVCPAFMDYSELLFDATEYLLDLLKGMVGDVSDSPMSAPPAKNPIALSNGHIIHKKWISTALSLINKVINVIDNNECDLDEFGRIPAERTKDLVSALYKSNRDGTATIPDEVIAEHFPSMGNISVVAPGGRYSFTVPKNGSNASSVDERVAMRQAMERCGRKLTDEQLDRILKDTNGDS